MINLTPIKSPPPTTTTTNNNKGPGVPFNLWMISWSPTGQLTCSPTCLASWKIDSNLVHSLNLDKAKTHFAFECDNQEFPQLFPTRFFVMPRGLCGLSASNITALAGVAHLRWRWRFGCNEFPCLAVDLFCFTKKKCVRFKRSSCTLTTGWTGWTSPIEAGRWIVGFASFFESGHILALAKTFGKPWGREVRCQLFKWVKG